MNDSFLSFEKRIRKLYDGIQTFVLFIGYGRSGHSLVAAILDAHPKIVIAHEFDVSRKWITKTIHGMGRINCSLTFTLIREHMQCLARERNFVSFPRQVMPITWLGSGKEHSKTI